jgi:hypothetical protein
MPHTNVKENNEFVLAASQQALLPPCSQAIMTQIALGEGVPVRTRGLRRQTGIEVMNDSTNDPPEERRGMEATTTKVVGGARILSTPTTGQHPQDEIGGMVANLRVNIFLMLTWSIGGG